MGGVKGHPKAGGRAKGTPNKVTLEIKELARVHGPSIIEGLVRLARDPSGAVAVAASRELLDRGYGKPTQPIAGSADGAPIQTKQMIIFSGVLAEHDKNV